jgi:hypothetical protein
MELALKYVIKVIKQTSTNTKIKIIPCILTDNNGIKLEISGKGNLKNYSTIWRSNNTLLGDQ